MKNNLKEKIIEQLKEVYDPEIPINVYDLGLIYEINIKKNNNVHILMTLTSPTCPTADYLKMMIEEATSSTQGVNNVEVELTFEPKWTPQRVAKEAKEELGLSEDFSTENLAVQNTFSSNSKGEHEFLIGESDEIVCFNCGVTDKKIPILQCRFKGEKTNICSKCINKF